MRKYLQKLDTLGLLLLVGAFIWYSVSNVWGAWNLALAIAGAALLIVGVAANYRQILGSLGKRSTKHAANYVISVVLVVAIVCGLNYIGQKHPKRIDTTASGRYTLAPQTVQILEKLDRDVEIKAFFPGGEHAPLKELLTQYRTESSRIRYEFIDPDRQPDIARQYDVSTYGVVENPFTRTQLKFGTVVISQGDRKEKIEKRSEEVQEQDLTNAIIKVGRSEAKQIYFVQGHGEKDPSDSDRPGFSAAKEALEGQGYGVGTVNLAAEGKVPDDAKVLIMAGPKTEPFPQEMQFISDFLNRGGALLLMVDPQPSPSMSPFLEDWGVTVNNDVVLDVSGAGRLMGTGPEIPLVISYEPHRITERFDSMTFFPYTRSLEPNPTPLDGITVEPLFKTSPDSWGETNLKSTNLSYDPPEDRKGPLALAVAITKQIKSSEADSDADSDANPGGAGRIVVTGTSTFPVNAYFPAQGNGNMFLNMVSWLAEDEDLISIRPKQTDDRRIILSQSQLSILRLITVFLLPGIALVTGVLVVVNRRRR
ncbi:MAG: GldG family protein [Acidobacteria bacterium]|nr:GldG family protein [Acidobacteriota bacterium]